MRVSLDTWALRLQRIMMGDYVWICDRCDCTASTSWCWYCRAEMTRRYSAPALGSSQLRAIRAIADLSVAPDWRDAPVTRRAESGPVPTGRIPS